MTTAATIFLIAAAVIFGYGPLYLAVVAVREHLHQREDNRRRVEQSREVAPEWVAGLASEGWA